MSAELTTVPSTVQCVKITVSPGNTQYVSPGANGWPASVDLGVLQPGQVTVDGAAYDEPCKPAKGSVPSWVADEVTTQVFSGAVTKIGLVFHQNPESSGTVTFEPPVQQVTLGEDQTYALMADGTIRYWGRDPFDFVTMHRTPTVLAGVTGATAIVARDAYGCAILADTTVRCWGVAANFSLLANGQVGSSTSVPPTPVAGLTGVTQLAPSSTHICALLSDQSIRCWGSNTYGQLFDNTTNDANSAPVKAYFGGGFIRQIAATEYATFALTGNGDVAAAGTLYGPYAQNAPAYGFVGGIQGAQQIAAGDLHACATIADGTVACWGDDSANQLGDGTTTATPLWSAVKVVGLTDAVQVAGYDSSTCAITKSGQVKCWGINYEGELGDGQVDPMGQVTQTTPNLPVEGITTATSLASGGIGVYTACAVLADATVRCWGSNVDYTCGDGTDYSRFVPVTPAF